MYGYIYKTTNKINGKIYIGQHRCDHFDESYIGSGSRLLKAVKKYGRCCFETVMLCECVSWEEMNAKEVEHISEYNSRNPKVGYNILSGGSGLDELTRMKISSAQKKSPNRAMLGRHHSEETRLKISRAATGRVASKSAREKMSRSKIGNLNNGRCNLNKTWIKNDVEQRLVTEGELDSYLSKGWVRGRLSRSDAELTSIREKYKNGVYVNKGGKDKFISNDCLELYERDGWVVGKSRYPAERGNKISNTKRGTICVTDGEHRKYIQPTKLAEFESQGYWAVNQRRKTL